MKKIEEILEKYFEGETSLKEEKMLREYFLQEKILESLEVYRPIFEFFSKEAEEKGTKGQGTPLTNRKKGFIALIRWTGIGIAAGLSLFFGIKSLFFQPEIIHGKSMVYISGKAFADTQIINKEALNSIENISDQNDDVISSQIDLLESFTGD